MNERIRELFRQSHLDVYGLGKDRVIWEATVSRFAESIVKECAGVVENLSPGYDDYRNQIEDAFRMDCVEEIKQHFGVRE